MAKFKLNWTIIILVYYTSVCAEERRYVHPMDNNAYWHYLGRSYGKSTTPILHFIFYIMVHSSKDSFGIS